MKKYDLLIIGPAAKDVNIDYTGAEDRSVGGAVAYCVPAASASGAEVFAAVKIAKSDAQIMDSILLPEGDKCLVPSACTTLMKNVYFTADRERRDSGCAAQSDPVTTSDVPDIEYKLCHLAGLLYGDFPGELIELLHTKGMLSADAQGFLRHNEGGRLVFHDWMDKLKYLPYIDVLKTDAAEAEILTGLEDRKDAAKKLFDWGAKEVLISHNSEMLVYDGKVFMTCPVKARNLSGRTGRGDTTFGAYLGMRMQGNSAEDSLLYATACVSLKMETPGVFRGSRADVEKYIRQFY